MKARFTLRRRLVLGIVGLLAFVSIVIGGVSLVALRSSLMAQLDRQVTDATSRSAQFEGFGGPRRDAGSLPTAGLGPGGIAANVTGGLITSRLVGGDLVAEEELGSRRLSDAQNLRLLAVATTGDPVTLDLGGRLGSYRFAAVTLESGTIIMVGLPLAGVDATVGRVALVVLLITVAGLALAFLAGTAIVRLALRPLERVTATASLVAELPLEKGAVAIEARVPQEDADPRTEVGQVGAAINRMLGHIASALAAREASEDKLRTFVADASHELRTPLTSIRGYAELTRRGGYDLPPDVVHSLSRVESEAVRMTSLVEDLLLLARLDEGRELASDPVDLTRILADAVGDAKAAGPDHAWALEVSGEPVIVTGDAARLNQVIVNLLANARVHTPAGTRVVASIARIDDRVEVKVSDNGPGIDPAVLATVFERFARADSSRSRVAGSTGLGLAIVAAVVAAHGGTVAVASEPGDTTFTVTVPVPVPVP